MAPQFYKWLYSNYFLAKLVSSFQIKGLHKKDGKGLPCKVTPGGRKMSTHQTGWKIKLHGLRLMMNGKKSERSVPVNMSSSDMTSGVDKLRVNKQDVANQILSTE